MPDRVIIRRLRREDGEAVRALDRLILGPGRPADWDNYVERFLVTSALESLIMPPWGCHVAEDEGEVAGFILAEHQTRSYGLSPGARIVALAVHPDKRGRGIGRMLLTALADNCAAADLDEIHAVLPAGDIDNHRFLSSCGFREFDVKCLARRI